MAYLTIDSEAAVDDSRVALQWFHQARCCDGSSFLFLGVYHPFSSLDGRGKESATVGQR